jgi:glycosyltransferase involved in cell wall biosynthesis
VLVSVIIPAYRAQATLARAVRSALAQTWGEVEVVIAVDDGCDYRALLTGDGVVDDRLRFTSTGGVRTGCHCARNAGLAVARGDIIAALDADDVYAPARLATLAPLAHGRGAAVDDCFVAADEEPDTPLYRALDRVRSASGQRVHALDAAAIFRLTSPLFPVVRRDHALARTLGVEHAEDVVANVRLVDRLGGALAVVDQPLMQYHVRTGSLCHDDDSARFFDDAYAALVHRCERGDGLGLSAAARAVAARGFRHKRAINQRFAAARVTNGALDFQRFVTAADD